MNVALTPTWTRDEFFAWAETQERRYEFDGKRPILMTGGTANHSAITINILALLKARLRGTLCRPYGPDAGIATVSGRVRYPDALVTCSPVDGDDRLIPNPIVVFEVVSARSATTDFNTKIREYAEVPSVLRYVVVETQGIGVLVLSRPAAGAAWTATSCLEGESVSLPEIGIELFLADIYEDIAFTADRPIYED